MDIITEKVRQQYLSYPFPNSGENIDFYTNADWFVRVLSFFEEISPKSKQSFLEDSSVLEAGCGTAPTISKIAQLYPSCNAVGVDLSTESLKIARTVKNKYNLRNLHFREANILEMDLGAKFDVIICVGVLHHLSNMDLGLDQLKKHLNKGGYIMLWLYGKHGRYRLNLHQQLFKTLFSQVGSLKKKISLTKEFLAHASSENMASHIDTPNQTSTSSFDKNLKQTLKNESWFVDQYLHVNENTLTISEILTMLNKHGLNLLRWLGIDLSFQTYVNHSEITNLFSQLNQVEKLNCLDLLLKPNYYMLAIN